MLFIEISIKTYIESWGQTFGTPDFDIRVWSVPASGSKVPGVEKIKFISPIDPSGVVTSGWKVKNCTGYCYRGIFIMDYMGSYVPNTSRRVLGFFFCLGSLCLAVAASSFFPRFSVFFIFSTRYFSNFICLVIFLF